jgi:hypothetical protein
MTPVRKLFTLVLACLMAQAQEYPHAFPRKGVIQLFDNERVTVWEATWLRGVKQPFHRHRYDMAAVYLRYGPIRVTSLDGSVLVPEPFQPPWPYYQAKGRTHKEEADDSPANPEQLAIMVDLKDVAFAPFSVPTELETSFPRVGATDVLDPRVRMWDFRWVEGKALTRHAHVLDSVEVFIEGGTLRRTYADGREETRDVHWKDARFVPRGTVDTELAVAGSPRAIVVELK